MSSFWSLKTWLVELSRSSSLFSCEIDRKSLAWGHGVQFEVREEDWIWNLLNYSVNILHQFVKLVETKKQWVGNFYPHLQTRVTCFPFIAALNIHSFRINTLSESESKRPLLPALPLPAKRRHKSRSTFGIHFILFLIKNTHSNIHPHLMSTTHTHTHTIKNTYIK